MKVATSVKLLALLTLSATMMFAQASRTWVSGVGDDVNPCSRNAPCKTFAGAISKTAAGGEIDALDPAGYGAVTITKAITIDGGGGQVASVLVAGTNGIVVQAGANDVVILRNIRINGINGSGNGGINGIRFLSGKALGIENCVIFGFTNNGIDIASAGGQIWVTNTTVANNTQQGLSSIGTATIRVSIDNSRFVLNNFGILAGNLSKITITNSVVEANLFGVVAQPTTSAAEVNIQNSSASNNFNTGIFSGGSGGAATIRMTGVSIFGNGTTGLVAGANGSILTYGNNFNSSGGTPSGSASPGPQ